MRNGLQQSSLYIHQGLEVLRHVIEIVPQRGDFIAPPSKCRSYSGAEFACRNFTHGMLKPQYGRRE